MKYTVSMRVDGRVEVEVEAENPTEAFEAAKVAFGDVELGENFEYVDSEPVDCTDETGKLTDYR